MEASSSSSFEVLPRFEEAVGDVRAEVNFSADVIVFRFLGLWDPLLLMLSELIISWGFLRCLDALLARAGFVIIMRDSASEATPEDRLETCWEICVFMEDIRLMEELLKGLEESKKAEGAESANLLPASCMEDAESVILLLEESLAAKEGM